MTADSVSTSPARPSGPARPAPGLSEVELRALVDALPALLSYVDPDQRYRFVNGAYKDWFGHAANDIVGRSMNDVLGDAAYEAIKPRVEAALQGETVHFQTLARYRDGGPRHIDATYVPRTGEDGQVQGFFVLVQDVSEQKRAEEALRESEARSRERLEELEAIYETSPVGLAFVDADGRFVRINRKLAEMHGLPPADHIGRRISEVVPGIADQVAPLLERLAASEEGALSQEVSGETPAQPGVTRYWLCHLLPLREASGALRGFNIVVEEITERRLEQDRRQLLLDELNHRVKNNLFVIQSIARQTFRGEGAPEAQCTAFENRLRALAAAHNLLTQGDWTSADLGAVVRAAVGAQSMERFSLEGPPSALKPSTVVSLAMALHELCTNASKYGALSNDTGRVLINWSITPGAPPLLRLRWRETGGPPVEPPRRQGFGSRMLERALASEIQGEVRLEFRPEGLVCDIQAALT